MISSNLMGGIGNYLFQIAAIHSLAIDNGDIAIFNFDGAYQVHNHINTYKVNILKKVTTGSFSVDKTYNEPNFTHNKLPYQSNCLYNGYFQSEKYFNHNRAIILDLFKIPKELDDYIKITYADTFKNQTCSIHVRHGDYVGIQNHHPLCSMEYYNKSINLMSSHCDCFLIFSDNIKWCKENFIGGKFIFIENEKDIVDLYLMGKCNHNIIANSSFSWWGAWLNTNINKLMIAPKVWFGSDKQLNVSDVYPDNCIIL